MTRTPQYHWMWVQRTLLPHIGGQSIMFSQSWSWQLTKMLLWKQEKPWCTNSNKTWLNRSCWRRWWASTLWLQERHRMVKLAMQLYGFLCLGTRFGKVSVFKGFCQSCQRNLLHPWSVKLSVKTLFSELLGGTNWCTVQCWCLSFDNDECHFTRLVVGEGGGYNIINRTKGEYHPQFFARQVR